MNKLLVLPLALIIAAAPLAAQTPAPKDGPSPAGWKFVIDRSTNPMDPDGNGAIKILTAGSGYHIETLNAAAAVFWNPANTVTGNYTLKARVTLNERSGHVNYYGLVFGGKNLGTPEQSYNYFLVAQDNPPGGMGQPQPLGSFLIKRMTGTTAAPVFQLPGAAGRSGTVAHAVVKIPDAAGKSVNDLEVRVQADKIDFVVNGTVVHSAPRTGIDTDGIWGIRANHLLTINVDGLSVTKQ
jgi:hypothetical protein